MLQIGIAYALGIVFALVVCSDYAAYTQRVNIYLCLDLWSYFWWSLQPRRYHLPRVVQEVSPLESCPVRAAFGFEPASSLIQLRIKVYHRTNPRILPCVYVHLRSMESLHQGTINYSQCPYSW